MSILQRIFANWKMSVGGLAVGTICALLVMGILSLAKCSVGGWLWPMMLVVLAGPTIVGFMGTDNGQKVG